MHFSTTKGSNTTTFGCILLPTLASYTFTLLHNKSSFSFTLCKVVRICVQSYVQMKQCCKNNFKIF